LAPAAFLDVRVDGRESSYFEWMGSGLYLPEQSDGSMHGRVRSLHQIRYGFSADKFFLRVDPFEGAFAKLNGSEFRVTVRGEEELRVVVQMENGKLSGHRVEMKGSILGPDELVSVACDRVLEISIARKLIPLGKRSSFSLMVALWQGGLPVDMLPAEGWLEIALGGEHFAWPVG
jgi:hypothetical protein